MLTQLPDGRDLLVWSESDQGVWSLRTAVWDGVTHTWGQFESLVDQQDLVDKPAVAVSPDGHVTVAFHGRGEREDLFAYTRDFSVPGSGWTAEQNLTGTGLVEWFPALAYDASGKLVVRYRRDDILQTGDVSQTIQPQDRDIAGGFSGSSLGLQADLVPVSLGLSISNSPPVPGAATKVRFQFQNVGWSSWPATTPAKARLYLGEPGTDSPISEHLQIRHLEPASGSGTDSSSGGVDFFWTPPSTGVYRLYAVIDSENVVNELREDNNLVELRLGVVAQPTLELDPSSDPDGDVRIAGRTPSLKWYSPVASSISVFVDSQDNLLGHTTYSDGAYAIVAVHSVRRHGSREIASSLRC